MIKKILFLKRISKTPDIRLGRSFLCFLICLLFMVGILCVSPQLKVQAASLDDSGLAGETEERTYINEPGSAQTRED